jgi:hypothetical protein
MGKIKESIKNFVRQNLGFEIVKLSKKIYNQDSLLTVHNHDFMYDPAFISAYNRGLKTCDEDRKSEGMHWRVHVALWAASYAKTLEGDFVECGVDKGFFSSAIMQYCEWNKLSKNFFLFDTFCGLDEKYVSKSEKEEGRLERSKKYYSECFERAKTNFAEFKNVHLVRGSVPETLNNVDVPKVCYLSLDMNCTEPEIAAANFFWDRMVSGAIALLDDYAYIGFEDQKNAFDKFAINKGIKILSLPTGQGLYIKP